MAQPLRRDPLEVAARLQPFLGTSFHTDAPLRVPAPTRDGHPDPAGDPISRPSGGLLARARTLRLRPPLARGGVGPSAVRRGGGRGGGGVVHALGTPPPPLRKQARLPQHSDLSCTLV